MVDIDGVGELLLLESIWLVGSLYWEFVLKPFMFACQFQTWRKMNVGWGPGMDAAKNKVLWLTPMLQQALGVVLELVLELELVLVVVVTAGGGSGVPIATGHGSSGGGNRGIATGHGSSGGGGGGGAMGEAVGVGAARANNAGGGGGGGGRCSYWSW